MCESGRERELTTIDDEVDLGPSNENEEKQVASTKTTDANDIEVG